MQIYDDGFKCWSCGTHGDVIDLASQYYGLGYADTVIRLNQDFNLQLPIGLELSVQRRTEMLRVEAERKKAKNTAAANRIAVETEYWFLFDMVLKLEEQIRAFAPVNGFTVHPMYIAALIDLPRYEDELERAEAKRTMIKRYE